MSASVSWLQDSGSGPELELPTTMGTWEGQFPMPSTAKVMVVMR